MPWRYRRVRGRPPAWRQDGCAPALSTAVSLVYFNEIKDLSRGLLGLQAPSETRQHPTRPSEPLARAGARPSATRGRTVEIKAGAHGHYYASAEINGRSVDVLVDSGASIVALDLR